MILAAGLGTRLRPLTENKPKALIPIVNVPVIRKNIEYLKSFDINEIIVNCHYHYDQIKDFLKDGKDFGVSIELRIESEILGTGGGIKNTEGFWDDNPFVVINSDILTDIDLAEAYRMHCEKKRLVTLILHDYQPFNQILTDIDGNIRDISRRNSPDRLAFTGIHIISPSLLSEIKASEYSDIIDVYRSMINSDNPINAFISKNHYWRDIGTIESYIRGNIEFMGKEPFVTGDKSEIDSSVKVDGYGIIGNNCIIESDVLIKRSIIWDNVKIKPGRKIIDSIITSYRDVERDIIEGIY